MENTSVMWPVLKRYRGKYLRQIAMPIGGIGTGTVSLGGRGNLQDWAIMNNPAISYTPTMMEGMRFVGPFFGLYTESDGEKNTIALEGALDSVDFEGAQGSQAPNHGLPRFRECSFETAYPLAQVHLKDDAIPLDVTLKAFNREPPPGISHPLLGPSAYPEGMGELLQRYREEYDDPVIYITENGCGDFDAVVEPDRVQDEHRIQYLKHYLTELEKGIAAGSDVRGYFMWTMVDNFEWSQGYSHRMGFLRVDHDTQKRTIKDSAYWYRDMIQNQINR